MGGGTGGYVQITLRTLLSDYKDGKLHRISELSFQSAMVPADRKASPALKRANVALAPDTIPAGKLGLGGVRPRDVLTFNLYALMDDDGPADMGLAPAKSVTDELEHAFGGTWAGFAVALAPSGGRFKLVADIDLKFRCKQRATRPFQVIPVVMAFGTDRFIDHYLLAVIAAQETVEKVDTSVTQPY